MFQIFRERSHFKINTLLNNQHFEKPITPSFLSSQKFRKTYSTTKVNKCFRNTSESLNHKLNGVKVLNNSYGEDHLQNNGENSEIFNFEQYCTKKTEDKYFTKNNSHQVLINAESGNFIRKTQYIEKKDFPSIQNKIKRYESLDEPKKETFDDFEEPKIQKSSDDIIKRVEKTSHPKSESKRENYIKYHKYFKNEEEFNPKWKVIFQNPLTKEENNKIKNNNQNKIQKIYQKENKNKLCDKVEEEFKYLKNNLEGLIKMRIRHEAQFTWEHKKKLTTPPNTL